MEHCAVVPLGLRNIFPRIKTQPVIRRHCPMWRRNYVAQEGQSQHCLYVTSFSQPEEVNCRAPAHFENICSIILQYFRHKTILKEVCLHHQAPEGQKASVACLYNVNFILLEYALTFILGSVHLTTWPRLVSPNQNFSCEEWEAMNTKRISFSRNLKSKLIGIQALCSSVSPLFPHEQ